MSMESVLAPQVGESVKEVRILSWKKNNGDLVRSGEVLLEIETDKASVEVAATHSGKLQISKAAEETVNVGSVLGQIDTSVKVDGNSATTAATPATASKSNGASPSTPNMNTGTIRKEKDSFLLDAASKFARSTGRQSQENHMVTAKKAAPKKVEAAKKTSSPKPPADAAKVAAPKPLAAKKVAAKKGAIAAPATTPVKAPAKTSAKAPAKAPAAKKAAAAKPAASQPVSHVTLVSPEQRANYVQIAAFYIAERRGFAQGNPTDDWLAAEAEVDRLIATGQLGR